MNNHQRKIILYSRVKRSDDDLSADIQKRRLEEYCSKHGLKDTIYYSFVGRAADACTSSEIEAFCRFAGEHASNQVVITSLDRICRDLFDYIRLRDALRQYNISLTCLDQNILDDEFIDTITAKAEIP